MPTRIPTLVRIHPDRHPATTDTLVFGCINIRSTANKVDDLLEVRSYNYVDVMLLTETWHDKNSVCFGRLRSEGFQVVEDHDYSSDVLSTNRGGVAAVAVKSQTPLHGHRLRTPPTDELTTILQLVVQEIIDVKNFFYVFYKSLKNMFFTFFIFLCFFVFF